MTISATSSAADLLAELDGLGIQLKADGERLHYRPRERVTADLAARMKAHKAELLALLNPASMPDIEPDDLPETWRELYEERAAIREYDGGQSRKHAEAEALREIVTMMRAAAGVDCS